jgi:hypothetical protein
MRTRSLLRRASPAGLPGPEAWRLSESELWLPEEVILAIVTINLNQEHELEPRLAVARLSTVCKAWDAALLPLFHPGVPGVITPAELRKLKRLALDQSDSPPRPDSAEGRRSQRRARPGFLLPERMLVAADFGPRLRTALTAGFASRVREYKRLSRDDDDDDDDDDHIVFRHLEFPSRGIAADWTDLELSLLLRADLYYKRPGLDPPRDVLAHFTNTVCCAYRILMLIKAVEARAMALGTSSPSQASSSDYVSNDDSTAEVSLAGWRSPSPAGMLSQLAWDVHWESSLSYRQMSRSLLAGSKATSLPSPADGEQDLLLHSFTLSQLKAASFPQGVSQDLVRKARHLFPLAFPKSDPLVRTLMVGDADSQSCLASRLRSFLRPAHVSDLQAALASSMHDLLGGHSVDEGEDDEFIDLVSTYNEHEHPEYGDDYEDDDDYVSDLGYHSEEYYPYHDHYYLHTHYHNGYYSDEHY